MKDADGPLTEETRALLARDYTPAELVAMIDEERTLRLRIAEERDAARRQAAPSAQTELANMVAEGRETLRRFQREMDAEQAPPRPCWVCLSSPCPTPAGCLRVIEESETPPEELVTLAKSMVSLGLSGCAEEAVRRGLSSDVQVLTMILRLRESAAAARLFSAQAGEVVAVLLSPGAEPIEMRCAAALVASLSRDGGTICELSSCDGATGDLVCAADLAFVWLALADTLAAEAESLPGVQDLARQVRELTHGMQPVVRGARA